MYQARVKGHEDADHLIQGYGYWKDGKGCALGCTMEVNNNSHQKFHEEIAPEWLAHLADHLFESLQKEDARKWTGQFLDAIPVGIPYDQFNAVRDRFQIFWLERQQTQIDVKEYPQVNEASQTVIDLLNRALRGEEPESAAWSAAESAARSARNSEAQVKRDWILAELKALK